LTKLAPLNPLDNLQAPQLLGAHGYQSHPAVVVQPENPNRTFLLGENRTLPRGAYSVGSDKKDYVNYVAYFS